MTPFSKRWSLHRSQYGSISFSCLIRDNAAEAEAAHAELLEANGTPTGGGALTIFGPPRLLVSQMRPYVEELGFRHVLVRFPAPFDHETIERVDEVRNELEAVTSRP